MGGGLMQLVAYGAQDVYLTGSPQITFFKVIYRRHTNFSVEPIPQTFTGNSDFGRTVTCTINRNGDLITNMYVLITLEKVDIQAKSWGYVRRLGLALIHHYKIEIGGSKIDEQYGDWLNIWWELSHKVGQERGFARLVGDVPELTTISTSAKGQYNLYVPLQFWFNRNNGLALPLIALQYHDVRITIDYGTIASCVNKSSAWGSTDPTVKLLDSQLVIDYVYLDSEERKRFAQASHEYLFEQLQYTGSETISASSAKYRLNFNHPCKFLIWAFHMEKYNNRSSFVAYNEDVSVMREQFAKLVWIATRHGLTKQGDQWVIPTFSHSESSNLGEVASPNVDPALKNAAFVASLIKAQLIFADNTLGEAMLASVDNVVLLENNVTVDVLSKTVDDLVLSYGISSEGNKFLSEHSIIAQDQFNYGNYLDGTNNPCSNAKLQLNGSDRFQERDGYYFNYVQPFQHFSNTPADGINVYSFALKPEEHQPSGTCNFSRIDNATLQVRIGPNNIEGNGAYLTEVVGNNSNSLVNIYAVNYNVLRVMSGMAGAAYSN